jgi:hypothetical protein
MVIPKPGMVIPTPETLDLKPQTPNADPQAIALKRTELPPPSVAVAYCSTDRFQGVTVEEHPDEVHQRTCQIGSIS